METTWNNCQKIPKKRQTILTKIPRELNCKVSLILLKVCILVPSPTLNTQSYTALRGFWWYIHDFCFLAVWAARPVLKKKVGSRLWGTFEGILFVFSNFWKHHSVHNEKLHNISKEKKIFVFAPENMKKPFTNQTRAPHYSINQFKHVQCYGYSDSSSFLAGLIF